MKSIKFNLETLYLLDIMNLINKELNTHFNGILINRYISGEKTIGAHSDNESGLDKNNNIVASLSFGATRTFRIRDKIDKKIIIDVPHNSGTLLMMCGNFQTHYTHELPAEKRIKDCRISLTFRSHIN